jgi:DNA-binding transcriptional ArsR family regulator
MTMNTEKRKCAANLEVSAETLARIAIQLKMLANPQRLMIMRCLVNGGAMPVYEIMEKTGLKQSTASQSLNLMRMNGLILSERRGKEIWYSVGDRKFVTMLQCICCQKKNSVDVK